MQISIFTRALTVPAHISLPLPLSKVGIQIEADTPLAPPEPFRRSQAPFDDPDQDPLHEPPPQELLHREHLQEPFPEPVQQPSSPQPSQGTFQEPTQQETFDGPPLEGRERMSQPSRDVAARHGHDLQVLLERFSLLHREGRLDQAAATLERALAFMVGRSIGHGGGPRSDFTSPVKATALAGNGLTLGSDNPSLSRDGFGNVEGELGMRVSTTRALASTVGGVGFAAHQFVPGRNEFASGIDAGHLGGSPGAIDEPGDTLASLEDGLYSIVSEEVGRGGGQSSAIAAVMNDLGCTYQQVGPGGVTIPTHGVCLTTI